MSGRRRVAVLVLSGVLAGVPAAITGGAAAAPAPHRATARPADPGPVSRLSATPATTSVALRWTNPRNRDLTAVVVRRAAGARPPATWHSGAAVATLAASKHAATDRNLAYNATYSYSVFTRTRLRWSAAVSRTVRLAPAQFITGTVRAQVSGRGVSGVRVTATSEDGSGPSGRTVSGAGGAYRLTGVAANLDYRVCFDALGAVDAPPGGYVDQCYGDAGLVSGGVFTVSRGTRSNIDVALVTGGAVSGQLVDRAGQPVAGIGIGVDTYGPVRTRTDANGRYTLTGMPAGRTPVCFQPGNAVSTGAPYGFWSRCFGTGDVDPADSGATFTVPVTAGATTAGIDDVLTSRPAVTGTVTGPDGKPLADVHVTFTNSDTSVTTRHDGTYVLPRVFNSYGDQVCFTPSAATPFGERCLDPATTPDAIGSQHGVDLRFLLPSGEGTISGTVRDTRGRGVSGVVVTLPYEDPSSGIFTALTDRNGRYHLPNNGTGSLSVCLHAGAAAAPAAAYGYADSCVTADTASPTATVDAELHPAGQVTGTVTDAAGHPLRGLTVEVNNVSGTGGGFPKTDAHGRYHASGLPAGRYLVSFAASGSYNLTPIVYTGGSSRTGYLDQCWRNIAPFGQCTEFTVAAGRATAHIDAHLRAGGGLTGIVTDASGHPLDNASVFVAGTGGYQGVRTSPDGRWTAVRIFPGRYTVCVNDGARSAAAPDGYGQTCTNGVVWGDGAHYPLTVTSGVLRSVAAIRLRPLPVGVVTGTVTDGSGRPVAGLVVQAASDDAQTTTAADGRYRLTGVAPGPTTVCTDATTSDGSSPYGHLGGCYGGSPPADVAVRAGATAAGVDITAPVAGGVVGRVTDSAGNPLYDETVAIFPVGQSWPIAEGDTGAAGNFLVGGLPQGDYVVEYTPDVLTTRRAGGYGLADTWSGGVTDQADASTITVTAGLAASGDVTVPRLGAVAGTVRDDAGTPISGASVLLTAAGAAFPTYATSAADGSYEIDGVTPGPATVCFRPPSSDPAPYGSANDCYRHEGPSGAPDPVPVAAGSLVSHIDGSLTRLSSVTVEVTDADGHPLSARVELTDAAGADTGLGGWADSSTGTVTIDGIEPGSYGVLVDGSTAGGGSSQTGYADGSLTAHDAAPGVRTDLGTVVLQPAP